MRRIPFYKPSLGQAEIDEVVDSLKSGWLTTGPKTKQFEADFARYLGHTHAVAVNSCTAALHLALEAIGLQAGDTVVVPTLTFAATAEVVRYFGATPLFVDCRPQDLNLDPADAQSRIEAAMAEGARIKAIIPVHYAGLIGDVAGVAALGARFKLEIIEDAAHCCPAYYRENASTPWKSVGSGASISCYSFYANKPITTGEGGMACTESAQYADRMRLMSLHGISRDAWKRYDKDGSWFYEIIAPGYKYNLTDIAAAIGLHQLRKADQLHQQRTERARLYSELLQDVEELVLPATMPHRIHGWHLYSIRLDLQRLKTDRAAIVAELKSAGIGTSVHWMPLHMHPYYRQKFGHAPEDLPCAASIYPQLITLPLYPDLTPEEVEFVCSTLKRIITAARKIAPPRRDSDSDKIDAPSAGPAAVREAQEAQSPEQASVRAFPGTTKRLYDLVLSACGLLVLSPLFLLIGLSIKLSDGGPIFFRQRRVGRHGRAFQILKFRTMVAGAERNGPSITRQGDQRITRMGRFLRRTKLDELPQLWNVFKGEMSLVGPRPEVPRYVEFYTPEQRAILKYQPGITDLASICFRNEERLLQEAEDLEKFYIEYCLPRKLELNRNYAARASLFTDTLIILRTVGLCLFK